MSITILVAPMPLARASRSSGDEAARAGDDYASRELERLRDQRGSLLASKPDLGGDSWAVWTGATVGGLTTAVLGAYIPAVSRLMDRLAAMNSGGGVAAMIGVVGVLGAIGAVPGGYMGWKLTRPQGAERDLIIEEHTARVARDVATIDRQIAVLGSS